MAYKSFTELPVWQAARKFKLAIYKLCGSGPLAREPEPRGQLRSSASKPPALIAEAYGRFNPLDSARLPTQAKAELIESQNHLIDAFDQEFITEAVRLEHHNIAQAVIDQVDAWRAYLQSPEAQRNVKGIRERRRRDPQRNRTSKPLEKADSSGE